MATNLLTPAFSVYQHMALDEVLSRAVWKTPILRFYHWQAGPAVTFGYAQFYQSVQKQCREESGLLCRRPTGGGIVFHQQDLTFSLIFQHASTRPQEIYAQLHTAIEQSLTEQTCLTSTRQGEVSASSYQPQQGAIASGCFINPVENDLLVNGQKILGGAIRRFGKTILYQGSLQYTAARTNPLYRRAVVQGLERALQVSFHTKPVSAEVLDQVQKMVLHQYATREWNQKF